MITYLKVRNLAIVEEFAIEPGPGLNVLTGETGAGKSLLIDSLEFLRGARSSTDMIRAGADKMSAEASFALPEEMGEVLEQIGIESETNDGGTEIIVRREIASSGRGRVLMNGSPVAVRELATAMDAVLQIHGQEESRQRIAGQSFRQLLDEFAGNADLLHTLGERHASWKETAAQLRQLMDAQRDRTLRLDLLRYQVDEIAAARLAPGEEEPLRNERSMLSNAREMTEATSGAFQLIDEEDQSALSQLARAIHLLQPLSREIADLGKLSDELHDVVYRLQEVARELSRLSETIRHDPRRLDEIEERVALLDRLKKKYGGSVESALDHLGQISDEYARLSDYEANVEKLQQAEFKAFAAYRHVADQLSGGRKKAAAEFEKAIETELKDLAMERTTVRVAVGTAADHDSPLYINGESVAFGADGYDRVEILVAPNRGEDPKPMQRIASGGELSRIQLAIAAALFKRSHRSATATLIFDEIDAGVGGRVAEVVGRKLRELAATNQVICVTHLPQIASFATTHFFVWKEDARGQTRALIRELETEDDRVSEVARMLGSESVAASALVHARELLESARGATSGKSAARSSRK